MEDTSIDKLVDSFYDKFEKPDTTDADLANEIVEIKKQSYDAQIDKLVDSFYDKFESRSEEEVSVTNNNIFELINNLLDSGLLKEEALPGPIRPDSERVIRFPQIKITENWGVADSEDRKIFEKMMSNIQGSTVQEKLASVSSFLEYQPTMSIPEILSNMIFLEVFSNIIDEFNSSTAGFLFEAFLAGLFGGASMQVSDPASVGASPGSLPIEDVQLAIKQKDMEDDEIVPYSLKVLSPGTMLKGSFKNLVDYFADASPTRFSDSITYLVVTKMGQGTLVFYEFNITKENFFDWIGHEQHQDVDVYQDIKYDPIDPPEGFEPRPMKKGLVVNSVLKKASIADASGRLLDLQDILDPEGEYTIKLKIGTEYKSTGQGTAETAHLYGKDYQKYKDSVDSGEFFDLIKQSPGYRKNKQFHIPGTYFRKKSNEIGRVDLYKPNLYRVASKYAKDLGDSLIRIYNSLSELVDNVNNYFLSEEGEMSRKQHGISAIQNARTLKEETEIVMQ